MLAIIFSAILGPVEAPIELIDVRVVSSQPVTLGRNPSLQLSATLKNRGKHPIRLWDPNNTEGSRCLFASLQPSTGNAIEVQAITVPRAGGVPTSIRLQPNATVALIAEFGGNLNARRVGPGLYSVTLIYRNETADSGPVRGVWTGLVRSRATKVKIVK